MRVAVAEVAIKPDFSGFRTQLLAGIKAAAAGASVDVKVNANTAAAVRQIKEATRNQRVKVDVDVDRTSLAGFASDIRNVKTALGQLTGAAKFGAAITGLVGLAGAATSLTSALGAAAGAALALPGILAGIAQGVGVAALATVGLKDAYKALGAASASAGKDAAAAASREAAAASSIRSAKNSVRDATIAVSRATADAAYASQQANQRVVDAERNVASVRRDVAQQIVDASRRVSDAERSLADSQRDARHAQEDLNQARRDAMFDLIDLDHELDRAKLTNERAVLDLERAKQRLDEIRRDPKSSALERKEAELAYREQRQRLDDTGTQLEQIRDKEERASKAGVEGSKKVQDAKEKIADAHRKIAVEARGVADAEADVARVRAEGGAKIAAAVREVGEAEQAAAHQRQQAAESVADAQRRLSDAQTSLAEAQKQATLSTGQLSASQTKLAEAMAGLSPAGQKFVRFLYDEVRPAFKGLVAVAQGNILGPLQAAMRSTGTTYAPMLRRAVDETSTAIGGFIAKGAELANSGPFSRAMQGILKDNVYVLKQGGSAALSLLDAFVTLTDAAGPLTRHLVDLAKNGAERLNQAIKGAKASGGLAAFFNEAKAALDNVLATLGNLGRALGGIFKAALPAGQSLLGQIEQLTRKFADWVNTAKGQAELRKFFEDARTFVSGILTAIEKSGPELGHLIRDLGSFAAVVGRLAAQHPGLAQLFVVLYGAGKLAPGVYALSQAVGGLGVNVAGATKLLGIFGAALAVGDITDRATDRFGKWQKAILAAIPTAGLLGIAVGGMKDAFKAMTGETEKSGGALHSAEDGIKQLARQAKTSAAEFKTAVRDQATALSDQFTVFDEQPKRAKVSANGVIAAFRNSITDLTTYSANLRTLLKRGLDPAIVADLAKKGPEYVAAFANASDKKLATLEGLYKKRQRAATDAAGVEAKTGGGAVGEAYKKALEAKNTAVTAAARKAFYESLHSPVASAKSAAGTGGAGSGQSYADQLRNKAPVVSGAAKSALVDSQTSSLATAKTNASAGGRGAGQSFADGIRSKFGIVKTAAGTLASAFHAGLADLASKAKGPLNGVIDLINRFIKLVNELPGVAFKHIGKLNQGGPVIEGFSGGSFNRGGRIPGRGPNRDSVPAMLTPGEYVVQRPAAKALGTAFLNAVNQAHTLDVAGDPSGMILGRSRLNDPTRQGVRVFNGGGWVLNPLYRAAGGSIPSVQQWIRAQDPKPYIWGATGPGAFDCSGLTGAAYGKLTGRGGGSGQRYFTTSSNFAALGFKRGKGTFTLGLDPGHHVAGNLAGLGFEARGRQTGIFVGGSARSVDSFPQQWYLPQIGGNFASAGGGGGGGGGIAAGIARAALNAIVGPIRSGINGLGGSGIGGTIAKAIGNSALDSLIKAIEDRVGVFHNGGNVTRDQLAYLQRGEHVLSAAQVRARGGDGAAMGGLTITVDARGSSDPGAVEAAARRGAAAALSTYRQARVARPRR